MKRDQSFPGESPMKSLFIALVLLSGVSLAEGRLAVGSKAPPLDIEHWLNKESVKKFETGKVYVVEFWATWCGPCVASMPHLEELQERYGQDLVVIGVGNEDPDLIDDFLERERDGRTYREITDSYWLTSDPDGSVDADYMKASGMRGIPTAFVVGKTGEIEWIGHPCNIDEPIAKIIDGTWNREAFAAAKRRPPVDRAMAMGPMLTRLSVGDRITIPVTGKKAGPVWGDNLYTTDSDPAVAAVHAGLLNVGETKIVEFWIVPSPRSFSAAERNGIQSRKWGKYRSAYIMRLADPVQDLRFNPEIPAQVKLLDMY
jgi:thiol-disulfide isomerase/thioredoxin